MKKIRRILQLFPKLLKEFLAVWKCFGFTFAFYGLIWWLCFYFRAPFSYKLSSWALNRKTAWLDSYIKQHYGDILNRFHNTPPFPESVVEHRIWVFWGQGEAAMPPLIQACYWQLKQHNKKVVLINCGNVGEYISLSPVIFRKVKMGAISWAHFSDIVRNMLLAQYGGLWLDATVWVSGRLPIDQLKEMPLFTANGTVAQTSASIRFWSSFQWSWSSWCLWSKDRNYLLFAFVGEMLQAIAIKEAMIPDYVMQDYLIYYTCRNFPEVASDMENCRNIPCLHRNTLALLMGQPYDAERYWKLTEKDFVFKLSFRTAWPVEINGQSTFYQKLLAGEL